MYRPTLALLLPLVLSQQVNAQSSTPVERMALFGELHIHTSLSFDARNGGTNTLPEDAYRFARGESYEVDGETLTLRTPLDFLAVTDHSEYMGMVKLAEDPQGPFANTKWPALLNQRGPEAQAARRLFTLSGFYGWDTPMEAFLRPDLKRSVWQSVIDAAEAFNQPGEFTTFVAYEWSLMPDRAHYHRNVIFAGPDYPEVPFSSIDSPRPEDLWQFLDGQRAQGIDAVAIPHNSNLSNGGVFPWLDSSGREISADYAELRARNEVLVEVTQNKGTSETHPALSPDDEFADFEIMDHNIEGRIGSREGSYVRDAYGRGLQIEARTGVNPFAFGLVGASDLHGGLSGTDEDNYFGAMGNDRARASNQLTAFSELMGNYTSVVSPGGITGVWAEENSRASIFAALKRRETFATSGTRIRVRFFGGPFAEGIMANNDWIERAYAQGAAMGATLSVPAGAVPRFLVQATCDPEGANLDRIQIVKVWYENGDSHEKVFDVAWSGNRSPNADGKVPAVGNTVNPAEATYRNDIGAPMLAAEWVDPEFDPAQSAVYYARVLEIPTPRWTTYLAVKHDLPLSENAPVSIQERAWTSPIFYRP
jgi:hypothetical protein